MGANVQGYSQNIQICGNVIFWVISALKPFHTNWLINGHSRKYHRKVTQLKALPVGLDSKLVINNCDSVCIQIHM